MFDLKAIDVADAHDAGADLHLRHPDTGTLLFDKDESPVTIRLAGMDSERYQEADRALTRQVLSAQKQRRNYTPSPEELDQMEVERIARCTVSWSKLSKDGVEFPCTIENARKLYASSPAIRRQVREFIEDRSNFSKT